MATVVEFLTRLGSLIDNDKCRIIQTGISHEDATSTLTQITRWKIRVPNRDEYQIIADKAAGELTENRLALFRDTTRLRVLSGTAGVNAIIDSLEAWTTRHSTTGIDDLYAAMGEL